MRALLIAEKPDLMRKVKAVYEKYGFKDTIIFKSFVGHTMGLISPDQYKEEWRKWTLDNLPIVPEKFIYKPTIDKKDIYEDIKDTIMKGNFDYIINCCDPGREGEHIFFSFYDEIGCTLPVKRMWHSDLTDIELKRALNNLRDCNEPALINMKKASKLRAYFDWLIGMNYTRAFSIISNSKVNIGRVMTPTLKILVDRELSITNFVPKNFWEIEGDFANYKGIFFDKDNGTPILNKADIQKIISTFNDKGIVEDVTLNKVTKHAPELHSLANLQNEANKVYGYTMNETLSIAQSLYEKQLLSYPRTDSAHLTSSIANNFEKLLSPLLTMNDLKEEASRVIDDKALLAKLGKNTKYVNDKKVSDHYAITPTGLTPNFSKLSEKEKNVYTLVCKRFLSIFLPPMITNKTVVITSVNGNLFKSNGSILEDIGYMKLYNFKPLDNQLPNLKKGDIVPFKGFDVLEKTTLPPSRYTDETLNTSMEGVGKFVEDKNLKDILKESKGIGTPATRGAIVEKLVELKMVERRKKSFFATQYGIDIIKSLGNSDIVSPELTAIWEGKLRDIENCTYSPNDFYKEMINYVSKSISDIRHLKVSIHSPEGNSVVGTCPKCGKSVKEGKKAYYCEGYSRNEDGTIPAGACSFIVGKQMMGATITLKEIQKILEGKETKEFNFKIVKNGETKEWSAKLIYDKTNEKLAFAKNSNNQAICKCPKCGGNIIEGKSYYLCQNYKKSCDLIIGKVIQGAKITKTDVKTLCNKKETVEKIFTWKSGKQGKAKLVLKDRVEFVFN